MKTLFRSVIVLVCAMALQAQAGGNGYDHDNGGDICENRFTEVRNDLSSWITKGGAASLRLPAGVSLETYVQQMLAKISTAKVSCIQAAVLVGSAEKTCKNFTDADGTLRIECNSKRFLETADADQYVLVHHEYAGLAGFEVNNGEASDYSISNQITEFLENQIIKKLVVRPPLDASIDPFDPASCTDEAMPEDEAKKLLQAGEDRVDLAPFTMFSRERWCSNGTGCGDWKRIENQLSHPDITKTRNFMLVPEGGVLMLFAGLDGHVGVELVTTPRKGNYSGQGAHLSCDGGGTANYSCTVVALPFFDDMGEAHGTLGKHCSRFSFKHRGFFADKAFFEMEDIYHNAALLNRGIWVERESVFLSRY